MFQYKVGVGDTVKPKKLSWKANIKINLENDKRLSFGIEKGICSFDTIKRFDDLQIFTVEI